MAETKEDRPGAPRCLAPDLTDKSLAAYKKLAQAAEGPVRDAMLECLRSVEIWWELPESKRTDGKALSLSHRTDPRKPRREVSVQVVPLEVDHARQLADAIPWPHEIEAYKQLFDGVEAAQAQENGRRVERWRSDVAQQARAKHFPDPAEYDRAVLAGRRADEWRRMLPDGSPGRTETEALVRRLGALSDEVAQAHVNKSYPGLPFPELAPTPTRDAAFHLLWHVQELSLDREPMTQSRLK